MGIHVELRALALGAKFLPLIIFTSVTIVSASVPFRDYYRFRAGSTHPKNQSAGADPVPFKDYIIEKQSFQVQDEYLKYLSAYYEAMGKQFSNHLEDQATPSSEEEDESDESEEDSSEEDHDKKTYVHHPQQPQPQPYQPEPPHHQDKEPEPYLSADYGINLKLPKWKLPRLPYLSFPVPKIPKVSLLLEYPEDKEEKPEDDDDAYDARKGRRVVAPKRKTFQSRGKLIKAVKVKTA